MINENKNNSMATGLITTVVWAIIGIWFLHYGLGMLLHGVGILLHGVGINVITLPFAVGIAIFVVSILLFLEGAKLFWKLVFKLVNKARDVIIKKRS